MEENGEGEGVGRRLLGLEKCGGGSKGGAGSTRVRGLERCRDSSGSRNPYLGQKGSREIKARGTGAERQAER